MMLGGMQRVAMGHMGVMRSLLVISFLVMFGGLAVVLGRVLVMLGGLLMMLVDIVFAVHRGLPVAD